MVRCPFLNDEICILDSVEVTLKSVTKTHFPSTRLYEIMFFKNNNQQVFLGDIPCKFASNFLLKLKEVQLERMEYTNVIDSEEDLQLQTIEVLSMTNEGGMDIF